MTQQPAQRPERSAGPVAPADAVAPDDHAANDLAHDDLAVVGEQLGRPARGVAAVAWRCPCGKPGVVTTVPRLPDGSPFPTTYYLTCPRATAACSALEAAGLMAEQTERLADDADLAERYQAAHAAYLADRQELAGDDPLTEIAGISAGGMPERVKCLHALVGHALAAGPGVNPFGDEAVAAIGPFWQRPCLTDDAGAAEADA